MRWSRPGPFALVLVIVLDLDLVVEVGLDRIDGDHEINAMFPGFPSPRSLRLPSGRTARGLRG